VTPTPPGFRAVRIAGPFVVHNGPLFARLGPDHRLQLGFRVEQRHTNSMGVCHGGMLATFADVLVPSAMLYRPEPTDRRLSPTISLQLDYMGSVHEGDWVQGEAEILRVTRHLLFGQAIVTCNGAAVLRVSGVYKNGPLPGDRPLDDPLGLFQDGDR
jgi:uncharacterized protein (TIGR00369 family)